MLIALRIDIPPDGQAREAVEFADATGFPARCKDGVLTSRGRNRAQVSFCTAAIMRIEVSQWVKSGHSICSAHVRFTPESGHQSGRDRCPLCASRDQSAVQQRGNYSITSSARPTATTFATWWADAECFNF